MINYVTKHIPALPYIMQYDWTFNLPKFDADNLEQSITEALSEQQKELEIFLSYYTRPDGAVAENASLEKVIPTKSQDTGKILLRFHKVFYNACLNIHETEKDQIEVDYNIDPKNSKVELLGPIILERGMDDI
ncbi:hypothetical protein [Echinicola vietnamensis]|uniref:Uncharacterized protein n=1 Tax=Echinicola vietnamensis (strain DSM 17526 / LMG 23754 / KMM 6221) TaxID=926556 RepID=L0G0G1_ECHVK|nr:hypothetical protein [Echinicola vietnamensis]AGA79674.1 hypothetical protein Echvi_3458 [Echinicola vietnamensis DSM 17526]